MARFPPLAIGAKHAMHRGKRKAKKREWQRAHRAELSQNERMRRQARRTPRLTQTKAERAAYLIAWKKRNREQVNRAARIGYWRRNLAKNEKLVEVIRQSIAESREDGLDDEDAKWIAIGAVNAEARAQGLVGDELPAEFNSAAIAIVESEMKK